MRRLKDFFSYGDKMHNTGAMMPGTHPAPLTIPVFRNNDEEILFRKD
jgi:hypothetical protein